MPGEERATLKTGTGPVVAAIRDLVQALTSPNGHPMSASADLERRLHDFAQEILRLAREPETPSSE